MEFEVRAVKKGFLWFKKVHFEVSYGDNPRVTDFCYFLFKLINMGAEKYDIWKIINKFEHGYYKVK